MRLLLDSCVWGPVTEQLRAAGHDVQSVREWAKDPGDERILRSSLEMGRILITLDKDFGELVFVIGAPHPGILRLSRMRAREQGDAILRTLDRHGKDLQEGALVVATPKRVRIRMPGV